MNTIQEALNLQGIQAAWNGDEPASADVISDAYLTTPVYGDMPRMVRTQGDAGNTIDIEKLKDDYTNIKMTKDEEKRIAEIKEVTSQVILDQYPEWKQRNMIARSLELTKKIAEGDVLPQAEQDELTAIQAAWDWVQQVRSTSDQAETDGTLAQHITWPTPV